MKIELQEINDVMIKNMSLYNMSVILGRALPNAYDGLKPVQRKILYGCHRSGFASKKSFVKCSKIVGEILSTLSPHGDAATYEALTRMSQIFTYNLPLIQNQGNMGTLSGDEASSMRYVEGKLHKNAEKYLLESLNENSVDMVDNYDNTIKEPTVLPSKFPILLANGAFGIAAGGISTNFPLHNVKDICNAVIKLIKNPDTDIDEISMSLIPDFPTGGIITSKNDIVNAYRTGLGNFLLRARIEKSKSGHLYITELPYSVSTEQLFESICNACKPEGNKEPYITEIQNVVNESSKSKGKKNTIAIKVVLKKTANPDVVIEKLYKHTKCETTCKVIMNATVGNTFKRFNIKELIQDWIDFRITTLKRIYNDKIKNTSLRIHIIDGLFIALSNIEKIIKIIKNSTNNEEAKMNLISSIKDLSELQADYILNLKLSQLTKLENFKLEEEKKEKEKLLEGFYNFVLNNDRIVEFIINEQEEIIKTFSKSERMTEVLEIKQHGTSSTDKLTDGSEIVDDNPYIIGISPENMLVKVNPDTFKSQKKAGMGKKLIKSKRVDTLKTVIECKNRDYLFVFTNAGKLHYCKVWNIRDGVSSLHSYLDLEPGTEISAIIPISLEEIKNPEKIDLLFITNLGLVKRTKLSEYTKFTRKSVIAIKLRENHKVIKVIKADDNKNSEIIVGSKKGIGCKILLSSIPERETRNSYGVGLLKLAPKDYLVSVCYYNPKKHKDKCLIMMTNAGYCKKQTISSLLIRKRNCKGYKLIKMKENAKLVNIEMVNQNSDIIVITNNKSIRIPISDVPEMKTRISHGSRAIKLEPSGKVIDFVEVEN